MLDGHSTALRGGVPVSVEGWMREVVSAEEVVRAVAPSWGGRWGQMDGRTGDGCALRLEGSDCDSAWAAAPRTGVLPAAPLLVADPYQALATVPGQVSGQAWAIQACGFQWRS